MIIANRNISLSSVAFLLPWLLAATMFAQGDPPARVARLSYTKGTVSLQPSGATDWSQATQNYTVTTGDRIFADQGGEAELQAGPFAVRLSESTDLTIANLNDQIMQLGLAQGTIRVSVYQLPSGNSVEVDTPNGALTLQEAGDYRVATNPTDGSTLVTVNSGSLQVTGGDVAQTVGSGQAVRLTGTDPIQIASVSSPRQDNFDQWSADRDRRRTSSVSAQYVNPGTPGYDDLDSSGRWQQDPQNGPVWYPSGVASNWVPYRNGHWAWVDPWGWTWVEDEPWGFTPFHYGRWSYVGSRWGWLPGPFDEQPYYAPALVAFVGGSGFSVGLGFGGGGGIQAWFPLGWGEPYFPSYGYSGDYLRRVNSANIRNVTNISNITNINNINSINYANRRGATTAVPTSVFNSGQAVGRRTVPVTAQQVAKGQIIARPVATPTQNAVVGGRPATAPARIASAGRLAPTATGHRPSASTPVAIQRAPLITKITPPATRTPSSSPRMVTPPPARNTPATAYNAPGRAPRTSPPLITRMAPPTRNAAGSPARTSQPPPTRNNAHTANNAPAGLPRTSPPLITRSTPPTRSVAGGSSRTPFAPLIRTTPPAGNNAPGGAPRTSPPLITRTALPTRSVAGSPTRTSLPPPTRNNAPSGLQRTSQPPITRSAPPTRSVASSPTRTSLPPPTRNNAPSGPQRTSPPPITRSAPRPSNVASNPQPRMPQNPAPRSAPAPQRAAPAPQRAGPTPQREAAPRPAPPAKETERPR